MFHTKHPHMATTTLRTATLSLVVLALFTLPALAQKVNITYLTSDINAVGAFHDANLVNPWGMSISPSGPWWISDNGTGLSTLYTGTGAPQGLVVTIPSATGGTGSPTGTVYNAHHGFQGQRTGHAVPVLH